MVKSLDSRGSVPGPAGGGYSSPPDPLAGGDWLAAPSPRTPYTLSALRAANLVAEGFSRPLSSNPEYAPAITP